MAAAPLLATVEDLGVYVQGAPFTGDEDVAAATLMLRLASGKVRDHCRQRLSLVADDVARLTPSERGRIFLPELPIVGVPVVESSADGGLTWTPAPSWTLDYDTGELADTALWPHVGPRTASSWRVTYSHGYAEIPDGIQSVVIDLAARMLQTPPGIDLERVGERQVKYSANEGLTDANKSDLAPYVITSVA